MPGLSSLPFPCRHEPPPAPILLPNVTEAVALAKTLECGFDLAELDNVTMFLGARRKTINLLGSAIASIDCAALPDEGYEDFDKGTCEFLLAATEASLSEGSVCYQAMVDYVEANAERVSVDEAPFQTEFTPKVPDMFAVSVSVSATCDGSDYGCNDIDECGKLESLCSGVVTGLLVAVSKTIDFILKSTVRVSVASILAYFGIKLATVPLAVVATVVIIGIEVGTSVFGDNFCEGMRTKCRQNGARLGLTCEGLACCPGETITNCGRDCCCCPIFYKPDPATCECVSA